MQSDDRQVATEFVSTPGTKFRRGQALQRGNDTQRVGRRRSDTEVALVVIARVR
jgi:hypothetical protein